MVIVYPKVEKDSLFWKLIRKLKRVHYLKTAPAASQVIGYKLYTASGLNFY